MSDVVANTEAARVAILLAQRGIRCWEIDPTADYTSATRQGAAEAIGYLQEVVRRGQLALDALLVQVISADEQRNARRERDQGALDSSV